MTSYPGRSRTRTACSIPVFLAGAESLGSGRRVNGRRSRSRATARRAAIVGEAVDDGACPCFAQAFSFAGFAGVADAVDPGEAGALDVGHGIADERASPGSASSASTAWVIRCGLGLRRAGS